ncbi:MAG: hypothetical protein OXH16_07595 [Gemmatimonadetes bacterium]|nr:hypothetical protein [Gemmatimonadota bacterium]
MKDNLSQDEFDDEFFDRNNYTALPPCPRDPKEPFIFRGEPVGLTLLDFWTWGGSDLLDNILRGQIAEYIVAQATEAVLCKVYRRWENEDIMTAHGHRVEVKSSAYFQSHHQDGPTKIKFDIAKKHSWDNSTGRRSEIPFRSAQVYVFCLLTTKDRRTINPLDLSQWEFYILSTSVINSQLNNQREVSLSRLKELNPEVVDYDQINATILSFGLPTWITPQPPQET